MGVQFGYLELITSGANNCTLKGVGVGEDLINKLYDAAGKVFQNLPPPSPPQKSNGPGESDLKLTNYYLCYTNAFTNHYEVVLWTKTSNKLFSHLIIIPRTRVGYELLSHALKNTANQRPGLPLHILRYATGSIPLYFPVITCAQQFTGGPFEDLKASSETLELLRTITNISHHVRKFSEDFRTLPNILKNHKNI